MNETITRIITASGCILFTLIMTKNQLLSCIYWTILTMVSLFEYHYKIESTRKKITIFLSLFVYILNIFCHNGYLDCKYAVISVPTVMLLFIVELFSKTGNPMLKIGTDLIGLIWICMPLFLCSAISNIGGDYNTNILYGTMIFVFVNDAGAYFIGRKIGRTKLFPSISPKKTWEGAMGGTLVSFLMLLPIKYFYMTNYTYFDCLVMYLFCSIFGTIGDLIESMFKRDLKIKDTSSILPGHGGLLDRIDGLLYSIPFVYCYFYI